jgi:SAM-dependent methyltransferase
VGRGVPWQTESFDGQADAYDERAGFDSEVGGAIADAILHIVSAGPRDVVFELGAGTGEIGRHLAASPVRYVGVDLSGPMLRVFRRKLPTAARSSRALLVRADCYRPWPVGDGTLSAVFASRVVHLLDRAHLAAEIARVCRPGGYLLIGQVADDPDGLKSRLRRQRRTLLGERRDAVVHRPRARQAARWLLDQLLARGATPLAPRTVAQWARTGTAEEFIAGWEALAAIDGGEVPAERRAAIFRELRDWARREFGDLQRAETFTAWYTIAGVRLPG